MRLNLNSLVALVVILTIVSTPSLALGQTPGQSGGGGCCEPNLEDYYHKKRAALELYKAASKQIDEALDNFLHNVLETMPEDLAKQILRDLPTWGVGKIAVVELLQQYKEMSLELLKMRTLPLYARWEALKDSLGVDSIFEALEIVGAIGVFLVIAEQLVDEGLYMHQATREMDDAKRMVAAADAMMDKALAALDKALRQSAACEKEREQRRQPVKSLDDSAHELMESWEKSPSGVLYKDPWGGPALDSQAAFERAKQILSAAASHTSLRGPAITQVAFATAAPDEVVLTAPQLGEVVTETDRGKRLFEETMNRLIGYFESAHGVGQDLKALQTELDNLDARTDTISKALAAKCKETQPCKPIDNSDCPPNNPLCHGLGQCR